MNGIAPRTAAGLIAGTLWAASVCFAVSPAKPYGSLVGMVSDSAGVPQMGATVMLFNRSDRLLGRTLTNARGTFGFVALTPEVYNIKVSLATFLPALKRDIAIQPGMQSLLNVSLATIFSSIDLIYTGPGPIMSDEWKWVLRSSGATRPVLRFADVDFSDPVKRHAEPASIFSGTRGLVSVSGGDSNNGFLGYEPDLGTAFALATSVFGHNQFQVAGNFGYSSSSGMPTTAFRTSYRRDIGAGMSPEVKLTVRQLDLPGRVGAALLAGQTESVPVLRSLSLSTMDEMQLTENFRVEYGFAMESVTFLDRLNYVSPFVRMTYDGGDDGVVQFSYASGVPPAELYAGPGQSESQLQQDISTLSLFPRVSLRSGVARVQRIQSFEMSYSKAFGSRTFSMGAYREDVRNAAMMMVGAEGMQTGVDLIPDLFSNGWIFNAGGYASTGYLASLTQRLGARFEAAMAYGSGGALTMDRDSVETGSPDELRELVKLSRRHSVTTRLSGTLPGTGTMVSSSYQWANINSLTPAHMYLTQHFREGQGLNLSVRQPLPYFGGLPGRFEATAEMRNMLAQGYVPLMAGGRRLYLMHTPRSVRGGFSFIF
jgi:hypothetical protein